MDCRNFFRDESSTKVFFFSRRTPCRRGRANRTYEWKRDKLDHAKFLPLLKSRQHEAEERIRWAKQRQEGERLLSTQEIVHVVHVVQVVYVVQVVQIVQVVLRIIISSFSSLITIL